MKSIFYLSMLSGLAYFGWTFVNNQQPENKQTAAQETAQPSQKAAKSDAIPLETVKMSSADKDSRLQLYVRKANKMDMENLSKRTEDMDQKTFKQIESVTNYTPRDIAEKRVHTEVKTPKMATSKYSLSSSANPPATVQDNTTTATPDTKKKLSAEEEAMLKTSKGLSKANEKAQSEFQKNVNKMQETLNQK